MKFYEGLNNLKSNMSQYLYCPKCNNNLEVVYNGFFGGQLLYCEKENKLFYIQIKEVSKSIEGVDGLLEESKINLRIKRIRESINVKNVSKVEKFLANEL